MKIGIIHSIYKPQTRGGAEVVMETIVSGLRNRGHEVFIICVGRTEQSEELDGSKVYRLKHFNLFNFFDLGAKPVWQRLIWHLVDMFNDVQTWRVFKILYQEKPDLVITGSLKGIGYEIPKLLKILKLKNIHIVHDMQLLHPSGLLPDKDGFSWLERAYSAACRFLFGSPSVVVFPSEYISNIYRRFKFFQSSEIRVIGNPLPPGTKVARRRSANEDSKIVFAFVGQLEEYKGILDLIKAADTLSGNWQLLIAGEGSAYPEAKKRAIDNPRIEFLGRLNQEELEQKIWSKADILINPSRVPESFGLVVIEAYAAGLPVLAAKIGALDGLVKDNKTGWLFKPKDQFDLKRLMEFILTNQEQLPAMKAAALQEAEKYQIQSYLSELLK